MTDSEDVSEGTWGKPNYSNQETNFFAEKKRSEEFKDILDYIDV